MSVDEAQSVPGAQRLQVRKLSVPAAEEYANLQSIAEDLSFVVGACERLHIEMTKPESDREHLVAWSLWTAALVTYARCFGSGKRKSLTTEDVRATPLDGDVVEWHKFLLNMRNKHVAHSVNPFEMIVVGAIVGPSGTVESIGHLSMRHVGMDDGGIGQTGRLAFELLKIVTARVEQRSGAVLRGAQELTPDELRHRGGGHAGGERSWRYPGGIGSRSSSAKHFRKGWCWSVLSRRTTSTSLAKTGRLVGRFGSELTR